MRRTIASLVVILFAFELAASGVGSKKAKYVGGTVATIKEGVEGKVSVADEKVFIFEYKKERFTIPYDRVNSLEYGQKAGRRLGLAIAVTPLALFSKKRKHFMTINYVDENEKQQAVVFELGKDITRVTLASMEARTGRQIEYQDDSARKSSKGN